MNKKKHIKSCEGVTCFEPRGTETEFDTLFLKRSIVDDFRMNKKRTLYI